MESLIDEKMVLALSRLFPEVGGSMLQMNIRKEAFGASRNRGLCYESCTAVEFEGDQQGVLYFCMDGYTRLKLMTRFAEWYEGEGLERERTGSDGSRVLTAFARRMSEEIFAELAEGGTELEISHVGDRSHELIPVDLSEFRQYIVIFFLRDRRVREYLGRYYFVLTIRKLPESPGSKT